MEHLVPSGEYPEGAPRRGLLSAAEVEALLPIKIRQVYTVMERGELGREEVWVGGRKRYYVPPEAVVAFCRGRGLPVPPGITPPAVPPPEAPVPLGHNGERKQELRRRVDEGLEQLRLKLTVLDAVLAEYLVRRFLRHAEHAAPHAAAGLALLTGCLGYVALA